MKALLALAAVAGLTGSGVLSAQTRSSIDTYVNNPEGQFFVENNQTKTIVDGKTDHDYRVCVASAPHTIGLKVSHDGTQTTVYPGDCADFEAKVLTVTPAGHIPDPNTALVGTYHSIRPERPVG
jgi:hypothetical protein